MQIKVNLNRLKMRLQKKKSLTDDVRRKLQTRVRQKWLSVYTIHNTHYYAERRRKCLYEYIRAYRIGSGPAHNS